ncbi:MAG: hypothetical protein IT331_06785 [Anaerolineae bacterium]|nr:hypothetical protein [Anaerolineae bacterium]
MSDASLNLYTARALTYWNEVSPTVPRLLSQLDRQPCSPSVGSFDREHWGWKFRDFPITMLQAGIYPLSLLWRYPFPDNPYYHNPELLDWIGAAIEYTCRQQHRNGAFDSVGPFTQDHGVSLAMVFTLVESLLNLEGGLGGDVRDRVVDTVRRSCEFAAVSQEDYAFISNHHALFAHAYLSAHELTGDAEYRERANKSIGLILQNQSSEGWYPEYGGPDPGYESLGIFYLALFWRRTRSPELLESLQRAVEFFSFCVHPDGSVGGVYGSRYTQLYFPGGFEILASEQPLAASVARFMRERLALRNVLTPAASDAENLAPLLYSYLEAALAHNGPFASLPLLPCQNLEGVRHLPESGIAFVGGKQYYAVTNTSKGGVCCIFDKDTAKLAFQDSGYLVQADSRRWTSQSTGVGQLEIVGSAVRAHCETTFCKAKQHLPTSASFVVLRLLNLTIFRSVHLGAWIRRVLIARLITERRPGPLRLEREIAFGETEILISDRLTAETAVRVEFVMRPRSFTPIHMGSARYFHSAELEKNPDIRTDGMSEALNLERQADCIYSIQLVQAPDARAIDSPVTRQSSAPCERGVHA